MLATGVTHRTAPERGDAETGAVALSTSDTERAVADDRVRRLARDVEHRGEAGGEADGCELTRLRLGDLLDEGELTSDREPPGGRELEEGRADALDAPALLVHREDQATAGGRCRERAGMAPHLDRRAAVALEQDRPGALAAAERRHEARRGRRAVVAADDEVPTRRAFASHGKMVYQVRWCGAKKPGAGRSRWR